MYATFLEVFVTELKYSGIIALAFIMFLPYILYFFYNYNKRLIIYSLSTTINILLHTFFICQSHQDVEFMYIDRQLLEIVVNTIKN